MPVLFFLTKLLSGEWIWWDHATIISFWSLVRCSPERDDIKDWDLRLNASVKSFPFHAWSDNYWKNYPRLGMCPTNFKQNMTKLIPRLTRQIAIISNSLPVVGLSRPPNFLTSEMSAALISVIIVNLLVFPFTIFLTVLVILAVLAVKITLQLRNKCNALLTCLE